MPPSPDALKINFYIFFAFTIDISAEKKGSPYDATVILDDTGGKYINFKMEFPKRKAGADGRK